MAPAEPPIDDRVGTVLRGKYRLEGVLGAGGMAIVYAATHRNQKRFAVKVLRRDLSTDAEIKRRFLREGYVANGVKHEGAVSVLDDDIAEDGSAFLVMELLDGDCVKDLGDKQRLDCRSVLKIAHGLLAVLASAHRNGITHRDVKPANVFVTRSGDVKVLDFGIARLRDGSSTEQTSSAALFGTPSFMAPEHAAGRLAEIGPPTDVWAVGAVIFTLLSGCPVHPGANAAQVVVRAATTHARSLAVVAPQLAPAVIALVDRALAFEPRDRWESADAMREAIERCHLEVFGEPIARTSLASLFAGASAAMPEATVRLEQPAAPTEASAPPKHGPLSAYTPSTARGLVAASASPVTEGGRSSATYAFALAGLLLLGTIGIWAAFGGRTSRAGASGSASPSAMPAVAPPSPASAVPASTASAAPAAAAEPATSAVPGAPTSATQPTTRPRPSASPRQPATAPPPKAPKPTSSAFDPGSVR